jgi:hypothetical protein
MNIQNAAGAVTFSVLSGVLLNVLLPVRASNATVEADAAGARLKDKALTALSVMSFLVPARSAVPPSMPCSAVGRPCGWSTALAPPEYRRRSRWWVATPPIRSSPLTSPAAPGWCIRR